IEADGSLTAYGQNFRAGVYPIGVVPEEIRELAESYKGRRRPMRRNTDVLRKNIISVDRLDYSKGLVERFKAYEAFLDRFPEHRRLVEFIQIAPTSRSDVKTYQDRKSTRLNSSHVK